jgi:hypothetical protein
MIRKAIPMASQPARPQPAAHATAAA